MKIRNILLMVTLVCFSLLVIGCSSYRSDKILSRVLNNKTTFITESGKTTYLKEYKIGEGTLSTPFDADPSKYVFVDMDGDRKNELVINISNDYGYYLVLHYNGKNVYGFEFTVRSLMSLKTDGSFMQSGGAASSSYCKISFDDDGYTIIDEAIKDSTMGKFELNGENASTEALNEFINDWNLKTNVIWTDIKASEENNNEDTNDNSVSKINLNDYVSVSFYGNNSNGYASVSFNKEKFLIDNIDNISFNKDNLRVYQELYGYSGKSAAYEILDYIYVYTNKQMNLSNGDVVEIIWKVDTEKIDLYFELEYTYTPQLYTVVNLAEANKNN